MIGNFYPVYEYSTERYGSYNFTEMYDYFEQLDEQMFQQRFRLRKRTVLFVLKRIKDQINPKVNKIRYETSFQVNIFNAIYLFTSKKTRYDCSSKAAINIAVLCYRKLSYYGGRFYWSFYKYSFKSS